EGSLLLDGQENRNETTHDQSRSCERSSFGTLRSSVATRGEENPRENLACGCNARTILDSAEFVADGPSEKTRDRKTTFLRTAPAQSRDPFQTISSLADPGAAFGPWQSNQLDRQKISSGEFSRGINNSGGSRGGIAFGPRSRSRGNIEKRRKKRVRSREPFQKKKSLANSGVAFGPRRSDCKSLNDVRTFAVHIHPSGILHAVRLTPSNIGRQIREEHAFAWIANCVHVDSAAAQLEENGFDRDDVAFLPYSSKWNWLDRYPHAEPALECDESGKVTVYLNYRPYPNGLGEVHRDRAGEEAAAAAKGAAKEAEAATAPPPKRRGPKKKFNPDAERLTELERDELHAEAYDYFRKLKERLEELEEKCRAERSQNGTKKTTRDSDEEEAESEPEPEAAEPKKKRRRTRKRYLHPALKGTKPSEIEGVLRGMEAAFAIIPGVAAELARRKEEEKERGEREKDGDDDEEGAADGKKAIEKATEKAHDVPFLERALKPAMKELVAARTVARASEGKPKRRSRVAPTKPRNFRDFDDMFERLVRYKEEHGDTLVPISYEDKQVRCVFSFFPRRGRSRVRKSRSDEPNDRLALERDGRVGRPSSSDASTREGRIERSRLVSREPDSTRPGVVAASGAIPRHLLQWTIRPEPSPTHVLSSAHPEPSPAHLVPNQTRPSSQDRWEPTTANSALTAMHPAPRAHLACNEIFQEQGLSASLRLAPAELQRDYYHRRRGGLC
ncbi:hypothetical protein ACHAWF_013837, partial [Thalassiosira exigua]